MPRELTDKQKRIALEKSGIFTVVACPGSGKTYTVAARLARLLREWQCRYRGICTISFTNVAWREIEGYLRTDFGVKAPLSYPHFLGTIDSFVNRFIFLPFGHLAMGCPRRPELIGPPHNDTEPVAAWTPWQHGECNRYQCKLNSFTFDINGDLVHFGPQSHFAGCSLRHQPCRDKKKQVTRLGYATQTDANYFGLRLLQEFPSIVKALVRRFPLVMVDEAQDTSAIQMQVLDLLVAAGLKQLMLVGDPNQAIFEWRDAEPGLLVAKQQQWKANSEILDENWRSTQALCDFASKLTNGSQRMRAMNPAHLSWASRPQIWAYAQDSELPNLFSRFLDECNSLNIPAADIAVLTRGQDFLNTVVPGLHVSTRLSPWQDDDFLTRGLAQSKFLYDRGKGRDASRCLETQICRHLNNGKYCGKERRDQMIKSMGFVKWRSCLHAVLRALPNTDLPLGQWVQAASESLQRFRSFNGVKVGIKKDGKYVYSTLGLDCLFSGEALHTNEDNPHEYGTVHSVKGRSFDAVILFLKSKGSSGPGYPNLLNRPLIEEEEKRILYVAVTRPRKHLVLVVPQEHERSWREWSAGVCHE